MSYCDEVAKQPLVGGPLDECILNEREQRHLLKDGMHTMPSVEYIELRDMYIKLVAKEVARGKSRKT